MHTIHCSMREDGFEFDKFISALDENYQPQGEELLATFTEPESYASPNERSEGTFHPMFLKAKVEFKTTAVDGFVPYYVDKVRGALAINAANEAYRGKFAAGQHKFSGEKRTYALTLYTMHETDGKSEYIVTINGEKVLKTTNIPSKIDYSIHERHAAKDVELKLGDIIQVVSHAPTNGLIPEGDPTAYARGRWRRNHADQGKAALRISRSIALVLPKSRLAEIVSFHFFQSFCFTCDRPSSYQEDRDGT